MLQQLDDILLGLRVPSEPGSVPYVHSGQIGQQIGRGIRIHFLDDVSCPSGIQRFDDRLLNFRFNFFQRLGCGFFVKRLEDRLALICWPGLQQYRRCRQDEAWRDRRARFSALRVERDRFR